jgi:hypothetical protein
MGNVIDDLPLVHHYGPIAHIKRLLHAVGDHHGGEPVLLDEGTGELDDLRCRLGVKGCGVLVKQQHLWLSDHGHEQSQCLALSPGKRADKRIQPVFKLHLQLLDFGSIPFQLYTIQAANR